VLLNAKRAGRTTALPGGSSTAVPALVCHAPAGDARHRCPPINWREHGCGAEVCLIAVVRLFGAVRRDGTPALRAQILSRQLSQPSQPLEGACRYDPMTSLSFGHEREAMPDVSKQMIGYYTEGNYGLLPTRWRDQLAEIRALPPRQGGPAPPPRQADPEWQASRRTATLRHVFISAVLRALAPLRSLGR
jgi:hypothetical protein